MSETGKQKGGHQRIKSGSSKTTKDKKARIREWERHSEPHTQLSKPPTWFYFWVVTLNYTKVFVCW